MGSSQKYLLEPSSGGPYYTAREALEKCIERDTVRRRLVEQKLEMAVRLLREAMLCQSGDLLSSRMPLTHLADSESLNHIEVIRASARTFGPEHFTLDQLCRRVAETFPGMVFDRPTISRRLFDLRNESDPVICLVSENFPPGPIVRRGRRYLYSYTGPPC